MASRTLRCFCLAAAAGLGGWAQPPPGPTKPSPQPVERLAPRIDRSEGMPQLMFKDYPVRKVEPPPGPVPSGVIRVLGYTGKDVASDGTLTVESQLWYAVGRPGDPDQPGVMQRLESDHGAMAAQVGPRKHLPIRQYQCSPSGVVAESIAGGPGRILLVCPSAPRAELNDPHR